MPLYLFKAFVPPHERHGQDGATVHVDGYYRRGVMSFRSGASSPNIFRGYVVSGTPVGVTLAELSPAGATWDMLIGYAARGGSVFVDSGAFSAFTLNKPMDWEKVLPRMRRLAEESHAAGARLHMVMPDVVGDQNASLDMLADHRDLIREIIAMGHDALVPIQKGDLSPGLAYAEAVAILGTDNFTASVPSNAAAFTAADLDDLMSGPAPPARIHLLGIAGNKRRLAELVRIIHARNPSCSITSDANRIRAQVGQGRPITVQRGVWAGIFRGMETLLDDPKLRAEFRANAGKIMAPGIAAASIAAVENQGQARAKAQPDLFHKGLGHHLPDRRIPTEAQAKAGNYPKERLDFQGLRVRLENKRGSVREGVDPDGKPWATPMAHHYGYVEATEGVDGDEYDVIIGPHADADTAYIAVTRAAPSFHETDEEKALLGFASEDEARAGFRAMYGDPRHLGEVRAMPMEQFKAEVKRTKGRARLLARRVVFLSGGS